MKTTNKPKITVEVIVSASIEKVWKFWNAPEHIMQWYMASDDWDAPFAQNDLRVGGKGLTTMAAKDGSFSFDFEYIYTKVEEYKTIEYTIPDGRNVSVHFSKTDNGVKIVEVFEAENENLIEIQQGGWQAILNNFKKHTEATVTKK